jgi:hypothetical protein
MHHAVQLLRCCGVSQKHTIWNTTKNLVPSSGFDIVAVQCTYSPMMAVLPTNLLLMPLAGAVTDLHTMVPNAHGLPAEAAPAALRVQTQANRHRQKAT